MAQALEIVREVTSILMLTLQYLICFWHTYCRLSKNYRGQSFKHGLQVKREGRVSTLIATRHYTNAKVALIIKRDIALLFQTRSSIMVAFQLQTHAWVALCFNTNVSM